MKTRLTVTIAPEVVQKAKQLAYARKTNVSALVENLLREAPISASQDDFVTRWTGKFAVAKSRSDDPRMVGLKQKYGISDDDE